MKNDCDCLFKVALCGDDVGKKWIFEKFAHSPFINFYRAAGWFNAKTRMVDLNGLKVKLEFWNPISVEQYRRLTELSYISCQGLIIVFDLTYAESFLCLPELIFSSKCLATKPKSVFIVGYKLYPEGSREVSYDEAKMFADRNGMNYIEVSLLTGHNVEAFFGLIAMELVSQSAEFIKIPNN